jgi:hypothetical protein
MKLTESSLKRIIREELQNLTLLEQGFGERAAMAGSALSADFIEDSTERHDLYVAAEAESQRRFAEGDFAGMGQLAAEIILGLTPVGIGIDTFYLTQAILDKDPQMAALAGIAFIPGIGDALAAPARAGLRAQRQGIALILRNADEALEPAQKARLRAQQQALRSNPPTGAAGFRTRRGLTRGGMQISKLSGELADVVKRSEAITDGAFTMVSRSGDELARLSSGGTARLARETAEDLMAPLADQASELQAAWSKLNLFKNSADFGTSGISRQAIDRTQELYSATARELNSSVDDIFNVSRRGATEAFQQAGEEVTEAVVREAKDITDVFNAFVAKVRELRRLRGARNAEPGWLRQRAGTIIRWLGTIGLGSYVTLRGAKIIGDWNEADERAVELNPTPEAVPGQTMIGGQVDRTGDGVIDDEDTGLPPAIDNY